VCYNLAKDSSLVIMEKVLTDDDKSVQAFKKTVMDIEGVKRIDTLYARTHGSYVIIDIKLSVESYLRIEEGHTIGKHVKDTLMDEYPQVENVLVHKIHIIIRNELLISYM